MKVLVLGANGFIGSAVCRRLLADGHSVGGIGRSVADASRQMPDVLWTQINIAKLQAPEDWRAWIEGMEAIVNCAGALQDGGRDDLAALQDRAMRALYEAAKAEGVRKIVQISAPMDTAAETPFLATKRNADVALKASGLSYVILRPSLVIGRNAFGGTALIRALAAFPWMTPVAFPQSPVETVALDDVADAVADALTGEIEAGSDLYLAGDSGPLEGLVALHRAWLGLPPARTIAVPAFISGIVSSGADLLGHLGWRSPLRSTAMAVMAGGVTGNAHDRADRPLLSLKDTLDANPAGIQDLCAARLWLLKFPVLATLSLFWIASGVITLTDIPGAADFMQGFIDDIPMARTFTVFAALLDITIGLAAMHAHTARIALWAMIGVSLAYLAAGSLFTPWLWLDPLGALVKIVPQIVLATAGLAILRER
ncbi:MAG: SDR family oxidoreductase [Rhodobiaceae bacterium]|nr:SDR family oxidoreductase [Rhodobiaceae bacterium]MCC0047737.1 SDR family oxidoreductase [Rhodobiaceae bacterium]